MTDMAEEAQVDGGHEPLVPETLRDRAAGALTGLAVGEVLGDLADGLAATDAAAAVHSALPDFSAATPGATAVLDLLGGAVEEVGEVEPGPAGVQPLPPWVAVAVATGLQVRADPIAGLVESVGERLRETERDRLTYAAAAAVAAAVSAALDETPWPQCLSLSISAADLGETAATHYRPGAGVGARIAWAHALAARAGDDALSVIELLVGVSEVPQEAVAATFAIIAAVDGAARPVDAARSAALLGGRAGLVAPLAGAIAGALAGASAFPGHLRRDTDLTPMLLRREDG